MSKLLRRLLNGTSGSKIPRDGLVAEYLFNNKKSWFINRKLVGFSTDFDADRA